MRTALTVGVKAVVLWRVTIRRLCGRRIGRMSVCYASAALRISSILMADAGIRVPGPKMAATPAL